MKAPSDEVVLQKFAPSGVLKAEGDAEDRQVRFVISTEGIDRDNDIIRVGGWVLDNFKRNPVVLWAHSRDSLPIAKALTVGPEGGNLVALSEFSELGMADDVLSLIRGGFINATSVGFRPLEWTFNEERGGIDFLKQELVEFSVVPVPANPEALIAASAAGVDIEVLRSWLGETIEAWPGELILRGKAWNKILDQLGKQAEVRSTVVVGDIEESVSAKGDLEAVVERLSIAVEKMGDVAAAEKAPRVLPDATAGLAIPALAVDGSAIKVIDISGASPTKTITRCDHCGAEPAAAASEVPAAPADGEAAVAPESAGEPGEAAAASEPEPEATHEDSNDVTQSKDGDEVAPAPDDEIVLYLVEGETKEDDDTIDLDPADVTAALKEETRLAVIESLKNEVAAAVDDHRGRIAV